MNFFERQRAARGITVRLVALFVVAVIAIVAAIDLVAFILLHRQPSSTIVGWMITLSIISLFIIGGGTISKTIALHSGGAAVAQSVGAVAVDPTTSDPQLKRFVNVVEEMSLASGVPMPRLFVMENEPGINAFAAGYTPADAAITATRGALDQLNRHELQGVIGHEFSHILNGDMRLSIRLIGLLNGILLLGLIGLRIFTWGSWTGMGGGRRNDRDNNGAIIMIVALVMMILGFVGQFFASLIKAAVSRQREWLADASSVQFTRNPDGLAGALKKIAASEYGSTLRDKRSAAEVSHMLFSDGGRSFSDMFATHPPLLDRIKALEPTFDTSELESIAVNQPTAASTGATGAAVAGLVGSVEPHHVANAQELSQQIPQQFRTLAGQPSTAVALVIAMLLSDQPEDRASQLQLVAQHLGAQQAEAARELAPQLAQLPPQLHLPLLSLAAPSVTARPRGELNALQKVLDQLARYDGTITLFEYCLTRLVSSYVADATNPPSRSRPGSAPGGTARDAASAVLEALALAGNDDPAAQQHAYAVAMYALTGAAGTADLRAPTWQALDTAWPVLDQLEPRAKQSLVQAMVAAVSDDGQLTLHEAELLRTACGLLHCPLPAFVA